MINASNTIATQTKDSKDYATNFFRISLRLCGLLCLIFLLTLTDTMAQYKSNGQKSKGFEAGAPAGSYSLSDFENINLYSGNLNFNMPLASIGGRGRAAYPLNVNVNSSRWYVDQIQNGDQLFFISNFQYEFTINSGLTYQLRTCLGQDILQCYLTGDPITTTTSLNFHWGLIVPPTDPQQIRIFSLNVEPADEVFGRTDPAHEHFGRMYVLAKTVNFGFLAGPTPNKTILLTRLNFTTPDGTEIQLRDINTNGKPDLHQIYVNPSSQTPQYMPAYNRGKVFVSSGGENIKFVSDSDIYDSLYAIDQGGYTEYNVNGYLYFPDGTTYRVNYGQIEWIKDVNGNMIQVVPGGVADSIGRVVEPTIDNPSGNQNDPDEKYDEVKYHTDENTIRTARVYRTKLDKVLRSDYPSVRNTADMFPELYEMVQYEGTLYNHDIYSIYNPVNMVSRIVLPDGREYKLRYNPYGELARVELPTGGAIEYDFAQAVGVTSTQSNIHRPLLERRVYADGGSIAANSTPELKQIYSRTYTNGTEVTVEPFVRNPSTNSLDAQAKEVHYYHGTATLVTRRLYPSWMDAKEYKTEIYAPGSSTPFRRTETEWENPGVVGWASQAAVGDSPENNPRVKSVKTTLMDVTPNLVSKAVFRYDDTNSYNHQTDVWEYGFGDGEPGELVRHTTTDYMITGTVSPGSTADSYLQRNILSLPTATKVYGVKNGQEILLARNEVKYDETTLEPRCSNSQECTVVGWTDPQSQVRGLPTTTRRWINTQDSSINQELPQAYIEAKVKYDVLGNPVETTDGRGNKAYVYYDDKFGVADNETQSNTAPSQLNGQKTFAFPTKVKNALNHEAYTQYNYFTGAKVNDEDFNGVVNKYLYNDLLDRPTQAVYAVGTQFQFQSSIFYYDSERRIVTKTDLNAFNDNVLKSESFYDSLGRTTESRSYESSSSYIASKTEYDGLGRAVKVYNPYRSGDTNLLWSTTKYDSLGRVFEVETPDAAKVKTKFSGNTTTVIDQAGKSRKSVTDSLGRLTQIIEDASYNSYTGANLVTSYIYDALGNLRKVEQGEQFRYFMYDSFSRLLRAKNPEQDTNQSLNITDPITGNEGWSQSYTYDANGNLSTKTDAKNITTSYSYDVLNRVTLKDYSDLPTPDVTYTYDDENIPNSKGKLTEVSSSVSVYKYTEFDLLGRIKQSRQVTDGVTYPMSYTYGFSGNLTSETYPSGRIVTNSYDSIGRLSNVSSATQSNQTPRTYASAFAYTASGAIERMRLGNGRWETMKFNNCLQPIEVGLGTSATDTSLLKLSYEYGEIGQNGIVDTTKNNGNIARQTITVPNQSNPYVQTYSYDQLNRLHSATEISNSTQTWKQTYSYDRYGNRTINESQTTNPSVDSSNRSILNPQINTANNRFLSNQGYEYDPVGNVTKDASGKRFAYNAENKQTSFGTNGSSTNGGSYFYDGDGDRVKKIVGSETTIFVYDAAGQIVAEYSMAAPPTNGTISYLTTDTLGTPRINTDANGQVAARHDYLPFGEEIVGLGERSSNGYAQTDDIRQKFTGYERDEESGLDYAQARYYSNQLGRFTSVDPLMASASTTSPQTWNRYSYVGNNPIVYTDPTGMIFGESDNDPNVKFFSTREEMEAAGYRETKSYAYIVNGTIYVLHPTLNLTTTAPNAAAAIEQLVKWGAALGTIAVANEFLVGAAVATTTVALIPALAYAGDWESQLLGEVVGAPQDTTSGVAQGRRVFWDWIYDMGLMPEPVLMSEEGTTPPKAPTKSSESTPANPDPEGNKPSTERKPNEPFFKNDVEAAAKAKELGFTKIKERSRGQAIFKRGNQYITRDVDGHKGGAWKMANSVKNLGSKSTRSGTYNENLTKRVDD